MNSPNRSTSLIGNLCLLEKLLIQFQKFRFFLFLIKGTTKKIAAVSNAEDENGVEQDDICSAPDGNLGNDGDSSDNNTGVINGDETDFTFTVTVINQGTVAYFPVGFILNFIDGSGWTSRPNGTARKTVEVPLAAGQSMELKTLSIIDPLTSDVANIAAISTVAEAGNHSEDSHSRPQRNSKRDDSINKVTDGTNKDKSNHKDAVAPRAASNLMLTKVLTPSQSTSTIPSNLVTYVYNQGDVEDIWHCSDKTSLMA